MKRLFIIFLCSGFTAGWAGDPKFPVSQIPEDLKKDVNAVVREDKSVYTLISQAKATFYAYFAVTILNANGNEFASLRLDYDKLTKITSLNGSVFDAYGKQIKKMKSNEIIDRSDFSGSLFSDDRVKLIDLAQSTYPYTVVFEYEKEYKFLYAIEGSVIIPDEEVSVQHSSYQLIFPPDLIPRYKTLNIETQPKQETLGSNLSLTWNFENLKPMKFEPMGPPVLDLMPRIMAAPGNFEYDGYAGNMSSWEEYGKWQLSLNKGRDILPDETKQKVKELTVGLTTTEQKAKVLYEYLQNKTRYVNIALGIGGLQPFEASVVDKVGYGDCKALSNYMVALLHEAGVKAYYTKIMAGPNAPKIKTDFPSHQTNHIIVGVPNGADTLWLECTSQTNPFGYQGTFTGDRKALMVTENGGKLVNTIRYNGEQNTKLRRADVFVEKTGNAKAKVTTTYAGLQYEHGGLDFVLNYQYDEQKKWLQNDISIPSFDISSFSMTNRKEKVPSARIDIDLTLNRFATLSGKRLFITPNLMNRSTFIPEKVENRKTIVVRRMAYIDLDTIRYHLPEELYPEFLPEPVKLKSRFGEYEATFKLEQGGVIYVRKMIMKNGEFPAGTYNELIDFFKGVNKADNIKLVFLNKT